MSHLRPVEPLEPLLTREELAELLRISTDSVDRMRKRGMPSVNWTRRMVRFRYSEVTVWLDEQSERAA